MKQFVKIPIRELIIKSLLILLATAIIGITVILIVGVHLGSDPISVWLEGLAHTGHVSFGTASTGHNILFLILALILAREYIRIGTVIMAVTIGPMILFFTPILKPILDFSSSLGYRWLIFMLASVLLYFGCAMTLATNFGFGVVDALLVKLTVSKRLKYRNVKIIFDLSFIGVGFLLGGVVGLGSILSALMGGPCVAFFLKRANHTYLKWLRLPPAAIAQED